MHTNELKKQLKRHEGFMSRPYRCPGGALSIGYGRNLDARGISQEEADMMLENDIQCCIEALCLHLPDIFPNLTTNRQHVLINMCFNLGIGGLLAFKKALGFLRLHDYENASREMLNSKWAGQVGGRAKELAEQMRKG